VSQIYLGTVQGAVKDTFVLVEIDAPAERLLQTVYMTEEEVRRALSDLAPEEVEEKIESARQCRVRTQPPIVPSSDVE
jgi:hypothetical protein